MVDPITKSEGFAGKLRRPVKSSSRAFGKKNRMVFLCSMGDLFHERVPFGFILRVFKVMQACKQHKFQVLTKRSKRLRQFAHLLPWPENVWMGVTAEDARNVNRIADLVATPAKVKFLSIEPLIDDLDAILPTQGVDGSSADRGGPCADPLAEVIEFIRRTAEINIVADRDGLLSIDREALLRAGGPDRTDGPDPERLDDRAHPRPRFPPTRAPQASRKAG
jgi:protein gp37